MSLKLAPILPTGKGKERVMPLRIVNENGHLYLERQVVQKMEVWRRSEFEDFSDEDSIEGAGYHAIEKVYPNEPIAGYAEIGETLYIAAERSDIPPF
jgi:hypothetical protein